MPSSLEYDTEIAGLEATVADQKSRLAVILTHPWGPLGGNRHNNVVIAAAYYFQKLGLTTVRFDFAGLQIGRGYTQVEQVERVGEALLRGDVLESNPEFLLIVGYSYGSLIAASARIPEAIGCISIAPPFGVQHWLLMFSANDHLSRATQSRANLPRLLILGDKDNFTSESTFHQIIKDRYPSESTTGAVLKDVDHFFRRREKDVMRVIREWLSSTYAGQLGDSLENLKSADLSAYADR